MKQLIVACLRLLPSPFFPRSEPPKSRHPPPPEKTAAARPRAGRHLDGQFHHRAEPGARTADGGAVLEVRRPGLLFRHDLSPRHSELRHSRRRLRRRLQTQGQPAKGRQRIGQRLDQPARHGGPRPPARAPRRRRTVLREPRRQRGARSESDPLGLCGIRQGRAGHGCGRPDQHSCRPAPKVPSRRTRRSSRSSSRRSSAYRRPAAN